MSLSRFSFPGSPKEARDTYKGSYLKSLPIRLPFSGSPGSGQELDACLMPPSFTVNSEHSLKLDTHTNIKTHFCHASLMQTT